MNLNRRVAAVLLGACRVRPGANEPGTSTVRSLFAR
jgi:hypothetical protein